MFLRSCREGTLKSDHKMSDNEMSGLKISDNSFYYKKGMDTKGSDIKDSVERSLAIFLYTV